MAHVVKRKKGNGEFYYLRHVIRRGNRQKEAYLGKKIPKDIKKVKREFVLGFYREEWAPKLERIRDNYKKRLVKIPKSIRKKELENFAIKFTYNTQKIEGSTLSFKETSDLLADGISPANRPIKDVREAELHQKLFLEMAEMGKDLSLQLVLQWHKKLFNSTKSDIAGKIRTFDVDIGGSRFIPPRHRAVRPRLADFFRWYNRNKRTLNPAELAAQVHLKMLTIHPFGDGNGRISRLMMNHVLRKFGYPLLDIEYNDKRSYHNALERSQTKKNEITFVDWFMRRYFKTHKIYLEDWQTQP